MYWSYFDIDGAAWFIDGGWDPVHQTVVINICFCNKRYFIISIGTVNRMNFGCLCGEEIEGNGKEVGVEYKELIDIG